ncbi:MAG: DNA-processing protein DprA [Firmicutes bacterium]|nr:DNA-processing protein DprA [Bacillota bacterium]
MADSQYAVWLQCALGEGGTLPAQILRQFSSFRDFYEAGLQEWKLSGLFHQKQLDKLQQTPLNAAGKILSRCESLGQTVLSLEDPAYPERLRQIADPPAVLYLAGHLPDIDRRICIAVVGTRDATPTGIRIAMEFCSRMAKQGVVIVSGGALGMDTAAHKGALMVGGCTVAVLGCGLNTRYLAENRSMRQQIQIGGALVSEYPPDSPALGYHFPQRNRIISGLSLGTLVVEAGEKSGSLITARQALEQGRDVFAVPGSLMSYRSGGSNRLLRDGAKPVLEVSDILEEYRDFAPGQPPAQSSLFAPADRAERQKPGPQQPVGTADLPDGLSPAAQALFGVLSSQPVPVDELAAAAKISAREALGAVTELEMEGLIEALPGKQYRRANEF